MCVGDKAFCKREAKKYLGLRQLYKTHVQYSQRMLDLAAAWMVMYASAK